MAFMIRMGIPEMEKLWNQLQENYKSGAISKNDAALYKKWGKALKLLSKNPRHPSLHSHDIEQLTARYGLRVWQSYLENKTVVQCVCFGFMVQISSLLLSLGWNLILKIVKMGHIII